MSGHRQLDYNNGHLKLTGENVAQLLKDPGLYVAVPSLAPLKAPITRFYNQLPRAGCPKCFKKKLQPVLNQIAGAFVQLLQKQQNQNTIKAYIGKLAGGIVVQKLEIAYSENNQQKAFIC